MYNGFSIIALNLQESIFYFGSFDFLRFPLSYRSSSTFLKSNFSEITQQNFKSNIYSERTIFTLLEIVFTLKFCRPIFVKFYFKKVEQEHGLINGNGYVKSKELQ